MESPLYWDGSVLRAPINALTKGKWFKIPVGPFSAAPFDDPAWSLGVFQTGVLTPIKYTLSQDNFDQQRMVNVGGVGPLEAHLTAKSEIELYVVHEIPPPRVAQPELDSTKTAALIAHLSESPLPFDVRFSFPRSGHDLWANSSILKKASPYFKAMLESGFIESQPEECAYPGRTTRLDQTLAAGWSDSDEDDDDSHGTPLNTQRQVHTIAVANHSFATYQAVWVWIVTKRITFAPLRAGPTSPTPPSSAPRPSQAERPPKRRKLDPTAAHPALPAVSPKSVYRLAHLLELPQLQALALAAFVAGLTVDNVAGQLASSTADLHGDVRAAAVEFAVENWGEVRRSAGMREMVARVEGREVDQGGVVMLALAQKALDKMSGA